MGRGELHKACMRALLASPASSMLGLGEFFVRPERFGQILDWLGPFDERLTKRVKSLVQRKWFHGEITAGEAEAALAGHPAG